MPHPKEGRASGPSSLHDNPFAPPKSVVADVVPETQTPQQHAARFVQNAAWISAGGWLLLFVPFLGFLLMAAASGTGVGLWYRVVLFVLIIATSGLFVAAAMLKRDDARGRSIAMACAVLLLALFPLGTALGAYLLWRLYSIFFKSSRADRPSSQPRP